ncbi:MAG: ComEC/Rec2 family competence protein [Prevotellaceae bacterium]|nr:ComEC/Rec2 family competence protein [Prevotellaceae bacterium]
MRRKNYYHLYPMAGIAMIVIIVILVGHECFSWFADKTQWQSSPITYQAVVVSPSADHGRITTCDIQIANGASEYCGKKVAAAFLADHDGNHPRFSIGDGMEITSKIETDTTVYARIGIQGRTFIYPDRWQRKKFSIMSLSHLDRTRIRMLQIRERMLSRLQTYTSTEEYAIIAAMTLGDKSNLTRETRDIFSQSGVSHVLALSGLHIGVIFFFLMFLVKQLFPSIYLQRLMGLFIVLPVWMFVFLVGMPTSAIRSATMITIYAFIDALGRGRVSFNTLCFAAVLILVCSPMSLYEVSFQLSFLSVAGIVVCYPLLYETINAKWLMEHRWVSALWSMTCVSITAQIATAPLVAYYFGNFSVCFLASNYLIIPATTAVLYGTIIFFLATPFAAMQAWIGAALCGLVAVMQKFLVFISSLPFASISNLQPDKVEVVMLYIIILLFFRWWHHNNAKRAELLLSAILLLIFYSGICN